MSEISRYKLGLHAGHPTSSVSEIIAAVDLPVVRSGNVGEQKITEHGKVLRSVYKNNYVKFALHNKVIKIEDIEIEDLIKNYLLKIDLNFTKNYVESGGFFRFILGIFTAENVEIAFDSEIIEMMYRGRVGIFFDIYGGPD